MGGNNYLELAGKIGERNNSYSRYFSDTFEVSGSPKGFELEKIFQNPQEHINEIVALSKYYYNKNGLIMRVINIMRDFGVGEPSIHYNTSDERIKKIIEDFNEQIDLRQVLKDIVFEKALTGNCAGYLRDFKRVDIFPISRIDVAPIVINNKPLLIYKIDQFSQDIMDDMPNEYKKHLKYTYPSEIATAISKGEDKAYLNPRFTFLSKVNSSRYEKYGIPSIITTFGELSHKTILKEAEKSTAVGIIEKILKVGVGDKDNTPKKGDIAFYDKLLSGQKGSIRVTVPYFVNFEWIEPDTEIFNVSKFEQVEKDLLSSLGVSLTLIRGEGGGNYSDGVINISGIIKIIENLREDIPRVVNEWYKLVLENHGENPEHAPKIKLPPVEIDKSARLELVQFLFQNAGLPYEILYEESGYDFTHVKLIREKENENNLEDIFKLREQPFQGNNHGRPEKDELDPDRKSDKSQSNNDTPRPSTAK